MKYKVLILSGPMGHASIAEAVEEVYLEAGWEVDILRGDEALFLYKYIYQYVPWLHRLYQIVKHTRIISFFLEKRNEFLLKEKITNKLAKSKPDVVIITWQVYIPIIVRCLDLEDIPIFNIVADPFSVSKLDASNSVTKNLVFDRETTKRLIAFGIKKEKIVETGWFVKNDFCKLTFSDKLNMKKRLGLNPLSKTILIISGSYGVWNTLNVLFVAMSLPSNVQIIVSTGKNTLLEKVISSITMKNNSWKKKVFPVSYTKNIFKYYQVSDVIVGKCGPNSLFEAVNLEIPFIATSYVSGQETGNLDLVRKYKIGEVAKNHFRLKNVLKELLDEKESYIYKKGLKRLNRKNRDANSKLLRLSEIYTG